jgi:hypothetical protein
MIKAFISHSFGPGRPYFKKLNEGAKNVNFRDKHRLELLRRSDER